MQRAVHYLTIAELAPLLQSRALSPVAVTQMLLERIASLDGRLMAYASVTSELAMQQAHAAQREIADGTYRGPLHGVPVAVKDLCFTKGLLTMGGSAALADHVPADDATVVSRLRAAGAVLLGKLNLTEGAMAGYHPALPIPENPWKAGHWAGASSSGSAAATAAGLAFATIGSDTGGSIRHPAAACGVVGFKPTWGRVSRYGVLALAESLDHIGPMARSARDAAMVLQVIAGRDPMDPTSLSDEVPSLTDGIDGGVAGMRIGWDEGFTRGDMAQDAADAVADAVACLRDLGATIVPAQMPARLPEYVRAWPTICAVEALAAHSRWYPGRSASYGPFFRQWLQLGEAASAVDYARAHQLRLACNGDLRGMMHGLDLFASPSTPRVAYPVTPEALYGPIPPQRDPWHGRYTVPFNFSGLPTISVPSGLSSEGLPFSLQLVGHPLGEALLARAANAYEQASPWHAMHPPQW